ncbi:MAG: hypothetical protein IPP12_00385 [Nitrospira sp.]|nr:hypothetical protein [Nitrospira sp.]
MVELEQLGSFLAIPRPSTFVEPEDESMERGRKLKELVWDKIPKHLVKQALSPRYAAMVTRFDWGHSWVLLGETGAGKSTACVHLVRELLRRGKTNGGQDFDLAKSIFWARADAITRAGGSDHDEDGKLLHRAEWAKLMVLDDLSAPSKTLLGVIQQRYDRGLPIVATCGAMTRGQFTELVGGDAVKRWISECGKARKGIVLLSEKAKELDDIERTEKEAQAQRVKQIGRRP